MSRTRCPWKTVAVAAILAALGATGSAVAQGKPANCPPAGAPANVEGRVEKVDPRSGLVTLRADNGTTLEFKADSETLSGLKVGDRVGAKKRVPPGC
jgi:Cu/Ag efflux protein CusF